MPQSTKDYLSGGSTKERQAQFYVLSTDDVSARLPGYVRLGKFQSKARLEWEQLSLLSSEPEESEQTLDFLLNGVDLPPSLAARLRALAKILEHPVA